MKRFFHAATTFTLITALALTLTACPQSTDGNNGNTNQNSGNTNGNNSNGNQREDNTTEVTLDPCTYNFIRGFDASEVDYYEEKYSVKWKDSSGTQKDIFEILKDKGVNTIRLRIWNDPGQFEEGVCDGDNTLERTISMAKRVKDAGLDLMLDFHYSDTWADPARQIVPAAWEDLTSADEVASAVSSYTTEVLTAVKNQAGIIPRYVQVGNEINPGLLLHTANSTTDNDDISDFAFSGNSYETGNSSFVPSTMVKYLKAGADAVRAFNAEIKIVLHLAGDTNSNDSWFFDPVKNGGVSFDIIGYSFYPWEASGMTIQNLKDKIEFQKNRYGVDVIVAECSSHWKDEGDLAYQKRTYVSMTDPSSSAVYDDLECSTDSGESYVKGSAENQQKVLEHIMQETYSSGGLGVFAWGGDKYGNYRWGMFDANKKALSSLDAFSYELADDENEEPFTGELFNENVTGTGSNSTLLDSSAFASVSESATVTVTFVWVSASDDAEEGGPSCAAGSTWQAPAWANSIGTSTFTGDAVSSLKSSGLTVWIPNGVTYTVTVLVE